MPEFFYQKVRLPTSRSTGRGRVANVVWQRQPDSRYIVVAMNWDECAVVRAAAAYSLESALRLILPDLRHSISSGDGRFTQSQLQAIEAALGEASGLQSALAVAA